MEDLQDVFFLHLLQGRQDAVLRPPTRLGPWTRTLHRLLCLVREVTERDLDEIFPVIALLEGRCAFEAARNASDAELAELDVLHDKLVRHAKAQRINDYYATNFLIHEAIIRLADNRWLAQSIGDLRKILKLARLQQLHAPGRLAQSLSEHLAVFAALKARDSEGADAAMRTHLTRQREALREVARQQQKSRIAS